MSVLYVGQLFVHKESRLVYSVWQLLSNGNIILECDDDGSMQNDDDPNGDGSPEEILVEYEPWKPGMIIRDRIGKGVFSQFMGRGAFNGIPPAEIENQVLAKRDK